MAGGVIRVTQLFSGEGLTDLGQIGITRPMGFGDDVTNSGLPASVLEAIAEEASEKHQTTDLRVACSTHAGRTPSLPSRAFRRPPWVGSRASRCGRRPRLTAAGDSDGDGGDPPRPAPTGCHLSRPPVGYVTNPPTDDSCLPGGCDSTPSSTPPPRPFRVLNLPGAIRRGRPCAGPRPSGAGAALPGPWVSSPALTGRNAHRARTAAERDRHPSAASAPVTPRGARTVGDQPSRRAA